MTTVSGATTSSLQVETDKLDYAPGETAIFSLSGFEVGATFEVQVLHIDAAGADGVYGTLDDQLDAGADGIYGTADDGYGPAPGAYASDHDPFRVIDGVGIEGLDGLLGTDDDLILDPVSGLYSRDGLFADLDGAADGRISTNWYVRDPDSLDERFLLTARDSNTGATASTTFTDAAGTTNKVYQHWSDVDLAWNNNILSDNKADYFEGEVIPHVFVYKASNNEQLVNGQSYSFNITYNFYQSNTNAGGFAYITTYDVSRDPGPNDATNPYIAPTIDSDFDNQGGFTGDLLSGDGFHTVDADITSVSNVTLLGSGTLDGFVTVTFTYTGQTTANGIAEIYYGLYVAEPGQVPDQGSGETDGANAWTGGSLQTTVDIGGSGASSIQLSPAAILVGEISGVKFHDLDLDGVRDDGEPGLANWEIVLDIDDDPTNGNEIETALTSADGSYSFSVTPDAIKSTAENDGYFVHEVQQAGWIQTAPVNDFYGPLVVSALTPQYLNQDFGNVLVPEPDIGINIEKFTNGVDVVDPNAANPDSLLEIAAGSSVVWTYTVSNTGSDPLSISAGFPYDDSGTADMGDDFALTPVPDAVDPLFNVGDDNTNNLLDAGEVWLYTASDPDGANVGAYINTAFVDGVFTNVLGDTFSTSDSDSSGYFGATPAIMIVKDGVFGAGANNLADVGELITYSFAVSNEGNVSLSNVTVTDPLPGLSGISFVDGDTDGDNALDVDETWTYSATYAVTQADIDAGNVFNTATADSAESGPDDDDETVTLPQSAAIMIVKDGVFNDEGVKSGKGKPQGAGDGLAQLGETVTYAFVITNDGNVTLDDVTLDDLDDIGFGPFNLSDGEGGEFYTLAGDVGDDGLLAPGETWTVSDVDYALTAADIAAEEKYNLATVTADDPNDEPVTDDDDNFLFLPANQRSISQDVSAEGYVCETDDGRFSGSVLIKDQSDDGGAGGQYDVTISAFDVKVETGNRFRNERDVTLTKVWADDNGNGLLDGDEEAVPDADGDLTNGWQGAITIEEPLDQLVLGFEFATDDGAPLDDQFRVTAQTGIIGRANTVFEDRESFDFNTLGLYVCDDQLVA